MRKSIPLFLTILVSILGGLTILYVTGVFKSTATLQEPQILKDEEILATVTKIKNDLKIGMGKKDVIATFGQSYIQVDDNGDLENGLDEHWKYPFFKDEKYHPSVPDHVIDQEGLRSRKIGVSLFIGWKNDQVSLFTVTYVTGKNNEIYMYLNDNGSTKEVMIQPDGSEKQISQ